MRDAVEPPWPVDVNEMAAAGSVPLSVRGIARADDPLTLRAKPSGWKLALPEGRTNDTSDDGKRRSGRVHGWNV